MNRRVQTGLALGCAALLAAGGIAATALATAQRQAEPWTDWSTLRLRVKSGPFISGSVEMRLEHGQGRTVLETSTTARFFGAKVAQTRTSTRIDPETGRTERYESFTKKRGRVYVFGPDGYVVEKLRPRPGSPRRSEDWESYWRREYPYPVGDDGAPVRVFDYYGMLLQLRRSALNEPGDEVLLHVATSSGPKAFRVLVDSSDSGSSSFIDLRSGEQRTLDVRMLRLRVIPADPGEADEGFLKMEGETELWVEAGSKAVLLLSGNAPKIPGRIKLVLREIG